MSPQSGSSSKMLILLMAGLSLQQLSSAEQPSPTLGPPGTFQICGGDSGQPCPSVSAEGTLDSAAASGQPGPASIEAAGAFDPSTPCPTTSLQTLLNQGVTYAQIAAQMGLCVNDFRVNPTKYAGITNTYSPGGCDYNSVIAPSFADGLQRLPFSLTSSDAIKMDGIAQSHSENMAFYQYFAHEETQPVASTIQSRVLGTGVCNGVQACGFGENIAAGYPDIRWATVAWMCSSSHRPQIVSCQLNAVGSGFAYVTMGYQYYYTQDFVCTNANCNPSTNCITAAVVPSPPPPPPPSPPPPPPATCFPPLTASPACGSYFDTIIVRDNGDGTCTLQTTINQITTATPCNRPVYPQFPSGCPLFNSSLVLIWRRVSSTQIYQQNMQGWLNAVGIGNPTVLSRPLTIYIEHSPNPVPPISPVFFTNVRQVGALVIKECVNCFNNDTNLPANPNLQSLPGFTNLQRFRDYYQPAGFLGSLIVSGTAMVNLASTFGPSLTCPPGQTQFNFNKNLRTLVGMQNVAFPYWKPGGVFVLKGSPQFDGTTGLPPIRTYAGCPAGQTTSTSTTGAYAEVLSASGTLCTLQSWNAICTFIANGVCT